MATINPSYRYVGEHTVVATWANFAAGDTLVPIGPRWADYSDRNVTFDGAFGGTVTFEGSNSATEGGANYQTLTDPQGNAISKTAVANEQIEEVTLWVRPTAGVGVTATNCTITMRRGRGGQEN